MSLGKKAIQFIDNKFYPTYASKWDDKILRETILEYLTKDSVVLDIGAGRGRIKEMDFRDRVKSIEGVDPDPRVVENPLLSKGYVGLAESMPFFEDERFDVIFCDNVLEHVEFPEKFYKEISRVLKTGGVFISKTPNKNHYVTLASRVTPLAFHKWFNQLRGRDHTDTFPVFYRSNTYAAQKKWGGLYRLIIAKSKFFEGRPEYLRISALTYPLGLLYERIVNALAMDYFKCIVVTVMKKQ